MHFSKTDTGIDNITIVKRNLRKKKTLQILTGVEVFKSRRQRLQKKTISDLLQARVQSGNFILLNTGFQD